MNDEQLEKLESEVKKRFIYVEGYKANSNLSLQKSMTIEKKK